MPASLIRPGKLDRDPSQGSAVRALLKAGCMTTEQAATATGETVEALTDLLEDRAHSPLWGVLAERICRAMGDERDQSPPREVTLTPTALRKVGITVPRYTRRRK